MVIGAGLAGAATCMALAQRGWHILLLDAAPGPAQGASGLPVGMLSPHITRAPTPLSELSALGVADMRKQLEQRLPQGRGWQDGEVDNLGHAPGRWPAALVRPAALVHAWLEEARRLTSVSTTWGVKVSVLRQAHTATAAEAPAHWQALDAQGQVLAQAPVVVIASAFGSFELLCASLAEHNADSLPLRPVKGQLSFAALEGEALAKRPLRDNGVFVPAYQDEGLPPQWPARIWAMGSTYTRGDASTHVSDADHERNAASLNALCPSAATRMRQAMAEGGLLGWAQVRCASLDRLPLAGALPDLGALTEQMARADHKRSRLPLAQVPRWPGLFTLTALGSRGLTLAHWCASRLAAEIDREPPAADEADIWRKLDPARFAWKRARRQPA